MASQIALLAILLLLDESQQTALAASGVAPAQAAVTGDLTLNTDKAEDATLSKFELQDQHHGKKPKHSPTLEDDDDDTTLSKFELQGRHGGKKPKHSPTLEDDDDDTTLSKFELQGRHGRHGGKKPKHSPNVEDDDDATSDKFELQGVKDLSNENGEHRRLAAVEHGMAVTAKLQQAAAVSLKSDISSRIPVLSQALSNASPMLMATIVIAAVLNVLLLMARRSFIPMTMPALPGTDVESSAPDAQDVVQAVVV